MKVFYWTTRTTRIWRMPEVFLMEMVRKSLSVNLSRPQSP